MGYIDLAFVYTKKKPSSSYRGMDRAIAKVYKKMRFVQGHEPEKVEIHSYPLNSDTEHGQIYRLHGDDIMWTSLPSTPSVKVSLFGKKSASELAIELVKVAKSLTGFFHPKDNLLRGITFEDLIDTVFSNEREINERTVRKVYKELLRASMKDAEAELRDNMDEILSELQGDR